MSPIQSLFDFSETEMIAGVARTRSWNWWDPWPENLTRRQSVILQISRDKRALEEEEDVEWKVFFAERIAAYQEDLRRE